MAKVIKKSKHLEKSYLKVSKPFSKMLNFIKMFIFILILASIFVYIVYSKGLVESPKVAILLGVLISLLFSIMLFKPLLKIENKKSDILKAGIEGESEAAAVLSTLPSDYVIFQDVTIEYDDKESEIDNILVCKKGVFVIETKNHKGDISGSFNDNEWLQEKIGRKGGEYSKKLYNPTKQVGTHIFRLAHFLKDNHINIHVEGIVYFINEECSLNIKGNSNIFVTNNRKALFRRIMNAENILTKKDVEKITELLRKI